jgi:hypothetical protein
MTFLERLASAGAPAVLIASSTGQGHLRTADELMTWFRCASEANVADMMLMALLRPEDGPETNVRLLDVLVDRGYTVVFLRPGTDLSADADDATVVEQLRPLVAAAADRGLAIGLYSIPDVSGLPLRPGAAARLVGAAGGDHIVAIKVTEPGYEASTARFLDRVELRHLKIVQGWDPHLLRALRDGPAFDRFGRQRSGITSGLMSLGIYQYLHILDAVQANDWNEAALAQSAVTTIFESMQDDPDRFADLQRAKYVMGLGHPLIGHVSEEQAQRLLSSLEALERADDRGRLARSLDLMGDGPYHDRLTRIRHRSL